MKRFLLFSVPHPHNCFSVPLAACIRHPVQHPCRYNSHSLPPLQSVFVHCGTGGAELSKMRGTDDSESLRFQGRSWRGRLGALVMVAEISVCRAISTGCCSSVMRKLLPEDPPRRAHVAGSAAPGTAYCSAQKMDGAVANAYTLLPRYSVTPGGVGHRAAGGLPVSVLLLDCLIVADRLADCLPPA